MQYELTELEVITDEIDNFGDRTVELAATYMREGLHTQIIKYETVVEHEGTHSELIKILNRVPKTINR